MRYEIDELILTSFTKKHMTKEYYSWFEDIDIVEHTSHGIRPYTKTAQQSFLADIKIGERMVWAIIRKFQNDRLYIGHACLQSINLIYRSAEFAILIGNKRCWGKGHGFSVADLIFNHGFNALNLNRICLGTADSNIGMRRIAEKIGMRKEGVLKQALFLNGKYHDLIQYGILKKDWGEKSK